ncbi:MAG: hypothetical protein AB1758_07350, partial [Candidatus Eremiobacterota bacterium]
QACPHVAGVAALIATVNPRATNAEIKDRLLKGTVPLAALKGKCRTGGVLNAENAVKTDSTPPATPGSFCVSGATSGQVNLSWIAPGEDGQNGQAAAYELRWSHQPIPDEEAFQRATPVSTGHPEPAGSRERAAIRLTPSAQERPLYVALRAFDQAANPSQLARADVRVPAARVVFEDSMEGGTEKWSAEGTWGRVEWPGRGQVWTDSPGGNYGSRQEMALTSQPLSLKGLRNSTLYFDCRYETEGGHDELLVEATRDGGRTWGEVARYSGSSDWKQEAVNLAAWDGQDIRVRFRFKTDRSVTFDGFYLDNVSVAGD